MFKIDYDKLYISKYNSICYHYKLTYYITYEHSSCYVSSSNLRNTRKMTVIDIVVNKSRIDKLKHFIKCKGVNND